MNNRRAVQQVTPNSKRDVRKVNYYTKLHQVPNVDHRQPQWRNRLRIQFVGEHTLG